MDSMRTLTFILCLVLYQQAFALTDREAFKHAYKQYQQAAEQESWSEALPYARESYELALKILGDKHKNVAALHYNYGFTLLQLRRDKEASSELRLALERYETLYGFDAEELIPVLMDLGASRSQAYQSVSNEKGAFNRALRIAEKTHGKNSAYYAQLAGEAADILYGKAYSAKARGYYKRSLVAYQQSLGENHLATVQLRMRMANFELATNNPSKASDILELALAALDELSEPSGKLELQTHALLVAAYEKQGLSDKATAHCLAIGRATPHKDARDYFPLVKTPPMYPKRAQQTGKEGHVIVEYDVDTMGFVTNPRVVDIEGPDSFASASMKVVTKFRYAPQFVNGEPVITSGVQNKFTFSLD